MAGLNDLLVYEGYSPILTAPLYIYVEFIGSSIKYIHDSIHEKRSLARLICSPTI